MILKLHLKVLPLFINFTFEDNNVSSKHTDVTTTYNDFTIAYKRYTNSYYMKLSLLAFHLNVSVIFSLKFVKGSNVRLAFTINIYLRGIPHPTV